jgi:hypothetical protein
MRAVRLRSRREPCRLRLLWDRDRLPRREKRRQSSPRHTRCRGLLILPSGSQLACPPGHQAEPNRSRALGETGSHPGSLCPEHDSRNPAMTATRIRKRVIGIPGQEAPRASALQRRCASSHDCRITVAADRSIERRRSRPPAPDSRSARSASTDESRSSWSTTGICRNPVSALANRSA